MKITVWEKGVVTERDMTREELALLAKMEAESADPELTAEEALDIIVGGAM